VSSYLINQALIQQLIDLGLGLPIAYENVDFKPPNDSAWLDVTDLSAGRESLTKAELDEETGIYQISYFQPSGQGIGSALENIDTILAAYQHNTKLTKGSQTVVIINAGRNEGRNEDGWWRVDISVSYKSDVLRV
jgi:hypothetical protein